MDFYYTQSKTFSVQTEIFPIVNDVYTNSTVDNAIIDLTLPNSMFINGIALNLNDSLTCQKSELGNEF